MKGGEGECGEKRRRRGKKGEKVKCTIWNREQKCPDYKDVLNSVVSY